MSNNMYRVGDYVYVETSPNSPYQIRRIEELNKTANSNGNVEAKVMCFYRRRDISNSLMQFTDKTQGALEEIPESAETDGFSSATTTSLSGEILHAEDRHKLRHHELFLSRQLETLPSSLIRGKCSVTLLNETESLLSYLKKEDSFFYSLVYDPMQKNLLADKGEIRVGSRYQSDITTVLKEGEKDDRSDNELETLVWTPDHGLTDRQIDQFLVVSRSVGTFARALDCSSSIKQPSLHMSAAAASRDVTLFHAMDTLHKYKYDLNRALCALVPSSGPVLCRDEMEEWSASEANLFEEALEKYGKDFSEIRQYFLPWKTLKNIIEYYYMWKTTDRYVQQKRVKAVEAESKLKQVYIPNYNKTNGSSLTNGKSMVNGNGGDASAYGKPCESCQETYAAQWYPWGASHLNCRLCSNCWQYWKKFGGLKSPTKLAVEEEKINTESIFTSGVRVHRCSVIGCSREYKARSQLIRHALQAHGVTLRPGSPKPVMKTRNAFFLHTSLATRIMRRLCTDIIQPRKLSRFPTFSINPVVVRQESFSRLGGRPFEEFSHLVKSGSGKRPGRVIDVTIKLGYKDRTCPSWLLPTDPKRLPKPLPIAYPKPPKGPDGSLIYVQVPNKEIQGPAHLMLKRKAYEETNGLDATIPPHKRQKDNEALDSYHLSQLGVNPPPGLTVTPIGVNGTPTGTPPLVPTPPQLAHQTTYHPSLPVPVLPTAPHINPNLASIHPIPPPHLGAISGVLPTIPHGSHSTGRITPQGPHLTGRITPQGSHLTGRITPQGSHQIGQILPSSQVSAGRLTPSFASPVCVKGARGLIHSGGGRAKFGILSRISGRPRFIFGNDAPDDVYFYATDKTRKIRNSLSTSELKRSARRPFRKIFSKEDLSSE